MIFILTLNHSSKTQNHTNSPSSSLNRTEPPSLSKIPQHSPSSSSSSKSHHPQLNLFLSDPIILEYQIQNNTSTTQKQREDKTTRRRIRKQEENDGFITWKLNSFTVVFATSSKVIPETFTFLQFHVDLM